MKCPVPSALSSPRICLLVTERQREAPWTSGSALAPCLASCGAGVVPEASGRPLLGLAAGQLQETRVTGARGTAWPQGAPGGGLELRPHSQPAAGDPGSHIHCQHVALRGGSHCCPGGPPVPDHMPLGPDRAGRARAGQPKPPGSALDVLGGPCARGGRALTDGDRQTAPDLVFAGLKIRTLEGVDGRTLVASQAVGD